VPLRRTGAGGFADFIESVAEQLEYRPTPSPPQAKWLKDLFMRRFNGRID